MTQDPCGDKFPTMGDDGSPGASGNEAQLLTSKACKRESLQQQKQVDINTDYYVCKKCLCSVLQEDIIL